MQGRSTLLYLASSSTCTAPTVLMSMDTVFSDIPFDRTDMHPYFIYPFLILPVLCLSPCFIYCVRQFSAAAFFSLFLLASMGCSIYMCSEGYSTCLCVCESVCESVCSHVFSYSSQQSCQVATLAVSGLRQLASGNTWSVPQRINYDLRMHNTAHQALCTLVLFIT